MPKAELALENVPNPIRIRGKDAILCMSVREGRKLSKDLRVLTDEANARGIE